MNRDEQGFYDASHDDPSWQNLSLRQRIQQRKQVSMSLRERIQLRSWKAKQPPLKTLILERKKQALDEAREEEMLNAQRDEEQDDQLYDANGNEVRQVECDKLHWSKIRPFFRHPWTRISTVFLLFLCNVAMYASDPVSHSYAPAHIPVIGQGISLMLRLWPQTAGLFIIKLGFGWSFLIAGAWVGRNWIHHKILRDYFKLKMFADDKGAWVVMSFTVIVFLRIAAAIYNAVLFANGQEYFDSYGISDTIGISNLSYSKGTAGFTWVMEYLLAYLLVDMMLQDKLYPEWAPELRQSYTGAHRILAFWVITGSLFVISITVLGTNTFEWKSFGLSWFTTTESTRSLLACVVVCLDFFIIMQDWNFPTFTNGPHICLPGLKTAKLTIGQPTGRIFIQLSHKWINYGMVIFLLILDMNVMSNQVSYVPSDAAQYVDANDHIWTITDDASLDYIGRYPDSVTYFTRRDRYGTLQYPDFPLQSLYLGTAVVVRTMALIPVMAVGIWFLTLLKLENPKRVVAMLRREKKRKANLAIGEDTLKKLEINKSIKREHSKRAQNSKQFARIPKSSSATTT